MDLNEIPCEPIEERDKYYLVFWHTINGISQVSQDLGFGTEEECDKVLEEVKQGKGLKFQLPYPQAKENNFEDRIYPYSIIKIKILGSFRNKRLRLDLDVPTHIGHNTEQSINLYKDSVGK